MGDDLIQFDLHIHSFWSRYKEAEGIVDESDIAHADVLMQKLNEYQIGLFSITDHNRFWPELYIVLDEKIRSGRYPEVKNLVAGVEFDVKLDPAKSACHIIAIFDAKNNPQNYQHISDVLEDSQYKIVKSNDYYNADRFQRLLSDIGLNTLLIAYQDNSLNQGMSRKTNRSLSSSTEEAYQYISFGYFNAIEFHNPKAEGILKNDLKEISQNIAMVMGSDCHQWSAYPRHDAGKTGTNFQCSKARMLPTFQGLVMAFTSPDTRINCQVNNNSTYLHYIVINGKRIQLKNGINVIFGENGAGKSTLLKAIADETKEDYVKKLIKENGIQVDECPAFAKYYIGQGHIIQAYNDQHLFGDDFFTPVKDQRFRSVYREYAEKLKNWIENNIKAHEAVVKLQNNQLEYDPSLFSQNYFIHITDTEAVETRENPHADRVEELALLIKSLDQLITEPYYGEFIPRLKSARDLLQTVLDAVAVRSKNVDLENKIRNIYQSLFKQFKNKIQNSADTMQKNKQRALDARDKFVTDIVNAVQMQISQGEMPDTPEVIQGMTQNLRNGYSFNCVKKYHNRDLKDDFFRTMFIRNYNTATELRKIVTTSDLVNAIRNCTREEDIEDKWASNLNSFLEEECKEKRDVVDCDMNTSVGNTMGQLSLVYYRLISEDLGGKPVLIIDQPEDNISNNNISKHLLGYFNSIRYKKQIILVTHNPLLVINLDADKVIYVKNRNGHLDTISGELEYKDTNHINILDLVAEHMDGGREAIKKRVTVYGKNDSTDKGS